MIDKPNVGVTGVTFARSTFSNQERVTVTAGVINRTDKALPATSVKLQVDNIPVGAPKQVALDANGSGSVTFDPVTVSRSLRGTVTLGDDGLAADSDSGVSPPNPDTIANRVTNDVTPTFWGRAEANATKFA